MASVTHQTPVFNSLRTNLDEMLYFAGAINFGLVEGLRSHSNNEPQSKLRNYDQCAWMRLLIYGLTANRGSLAEYLYCRLVPVYMSDESDKYPIAPRVYF